MNNYIVVVGMPYAPYIKTIMINANDIQNVLFTLQAQGIMGPNILSVRLDGL